MNPSPAMPYPRGERHPRHKYPDALVEEARQLRERGWTARRIGEHLGVNFRTVKDWIQYRTRDEPHDGEPLRKRRYGAKSI
jgi:hypothetical protein